MCEQAVATHHSEPAFSEAYRKRQRGLLLFWSEEIKERYDHWYAYRMVRLHFFHCPLRRSEEPLGEFSLLRELEFGADGETLSLWGLTQFVNGLLCVSEMDGWASDLRLTLHNICTGEKMRIPDCLPCVHTYSTYHLGYDPTRRMYKLLRLIFRVGDESFQGAHIMNLRSPSDSQSTWRELDYNVAGLRSLHFLRGDHLSEERTSPEDGMLCWTQAFFPQGHQRLICFDLNRESFWFVEHPVAGPGLEMVRFSSLTRAITRFMDRLVIWFSSSADDFHVISCYVQEDGEGKNWSTKCIEFSKEFKESEGFVVEPGNKTYFSRGEMLVRNSDQSWRVYSFSGRHAQHTDKEDVLFLGKLPDRAPILACITLSQCWSYFEPVTLRDVFSFPESKNLYQSLDDVLSGSASM